MHLLNVAADLVIFAGFVLMPFTWFRLLPLTLSVRLAGILFFLSSAVTRLAFALGFEHSHGITAVRLVQAVAVIWFVLGFWRLLMRAEEIWRQAEVRYRARSTTIKITETVDARDEEAR